PRQRDHGRERRQSRRGNATLHRRRKRVGGGGAWRDGLRPARRVPRRLPRDHAVIAVTPYTAQHDGQDYSADAPQLDMRVIHRYLSEESYWAPGIPREVVERSLAGSLGLGLYHELYHEAGEGAPMVGFARVVTDRATFAYLCDVFVLPAHRGKGLGVWLTDCVLAHPDLQGLRRLLLTTQTAHAVSEKPGFV